MTIDFSVDFMYPIPDELAEFLQSDRSITCLHFESLDHTLINQSIAHMSTSSVSISHAKKPQQPPSYSDTYDMDSISEIKEQNTRSMMLQYDDDNSITSSSISALIASVTTSNSNPTTTTGSISTALSNGHETEQLEKVTQTDLTQRKIEKMLEANIDLRSMLQNSQQMIGMLKRTSHLQFDEISNTLLTIALHCRRTQEW